MSCDVDPNFHARVCACNFPKNSVLFPPPGNGYDGNCCEVGSEAGFPQITAIGSTFKLEDISNYCTAVLRRLDLS
jgi:hypothetical protein